MTVRNMLQSFLVLSLLTSAAISHADDGRPGRFPGPQNGGGQPGFGGGQGPGGGRGQGPGPARPQPEPPRHDDHGGFPGHGGGYQPGYPGHGGGGYNPRPQPPYRPEPHPRPRPPYQPPYNPPPVYNPPPAVSSQSSVSAANITRQAGGEWVRVNVNYPVRINYIQVATYVAAVQIHEAYVTTTSGARYQVRELTETGSFSSQRVSEILNIYEPIVAIDLRAESMGGYATLNVTVDSTDGSTALSVTRY